MSSPLRRRPFSDHLSDEDSPALKGPVLVEDEEEHLERYLQTRSPRPPSTYLSSKIARDKLFRLDKRDRERSESPSSHMPHCIATIYAALEDELGPPTPQAGSRKARALSHVLAIPQTGDAPILPLSPFLV